jgi:hypothetical protein
MRTFIFVALIGLALTSVPPGITQADFTVGTWAGQGYQNPAGAVPSWTIRLRILENGNGIIQYPSLSCGGTLMKQPIAGVAAYREHIDYGKDKCIDNGRVVIQERADELFWYWSGEGTKAPTASATAVLSRVSAQQQSIERVAAPQSTPRNSSPQSSGSPPADPFSFCQSVKNTQVNFHEDEPQK